MRFPEKFSSALDARIPQGHESVYNSVEPLTPTMTLMVESEVPASAALDDFDAVMRLHRDRVFRFVLASLRDRDAAETLTQECFLRAWRCREQFRGDARLTTWLLQIAINLVRDHARNRRMQFWRRLRESAVEVETAGTWIADQHSSAEAGIIASEQLRAVWSVVEKFSERQRTVFLLRFVEEMELTEIAAATGMKEGTVKTHLSRALRTIRGQLGGAR